MFLTCLFCSWQISFVFLVNFSFGFLWRSSVTIVQTVVFFSVCRNRCLMRFRKNAGTRTTFLRLILNLSAEQLSAAFIPCMGLSLPEMAGCLLFFRRIGTPHACANQNVILTGCILCALTLYSLCASKCTPLLPQRLGQKSADGWGWRKILFKTFWDTPWMPSLRGDSPLGVISDEDGTPLGVIEGGCLLKTLHQWAKRLGQFVKQDQRGCFGEW